MHYTTAHNHLNLYGFSSSVEHRERCLAECAQCSYPCNGNDRLFSCELLKPVPSVHACVCVCGEQLFREGRVMLGLMLLIKPRSPEPRSRCSWTPGQQEELQLQALACLSSLAPLMLDDYMTCQGNTLLLLLLDWCLQEGTAPSLPAHYISYLCPH